MVVFHGFAALTNSKQYQLPVSLKLFLYYRKLAGISSYTGSFLIGGHQQLRATTKIKGYFKIYRNIFCKAIIINGEQDVVCPSLPAVQPTPKLTGDA
jgi:hypothetical protein